MSYAISILCLACINNKTIITSTESNPPLRPNNVESHASPMLFVNVRGDSLWYWNAYLGTDESGCIHNLKTYNPDKTTNNTKFVVIGNKELIVDHDNLSYNFDYIFSASPIWSINNNEYEIFKIQSPKLENPCVSGDTTGTYIPTISTNYGVEYSCLIAGENENEFEIIGQEKLVTLSLENKSIKSVSVDEIISLDLKRKFILTSKSCKWHSIQIE